MLMQLQLWLGYGRRESRNFYNHATAIADHSLKTMLYVLYTEKLRERESMTLHLAITMIREVKVRIIYIPRLLGLYFLAIDTIILTLTSLIMVMAK